LRKQQKTLVRLAGGSIRAGEDLPQWANRLGDLRASQISFECDQRRFIPEWCGP
jgi:hypothetical protein